MTPRTPTLAVSLAALLTLGSAASAVAKRVQTPTLLDVAREEIAEELLLDVGIELFADGLPTNDYAALAELEAEDGVYEDVRRAEGRFIAVHLMDTLQSTGHWGAVRILPEAAGEVDLRVGGRIVESSGYELEVEIWVHDATGKKWLERDYKEVADAGHYRDDLVREPFQSLYNTIANDLRDKLERRDAEERLEIRRTTAMRFASDLAPDAFASYVERDRRGRIKAVRLPADGDVMMARVERIRDRDDLFVDTLSAH
ncbi:MAG: hypothetical protein AAFX50_23935, partial [Acidobacteriota bacterium]